MNWRRLNREQTKTILGSVQTAAEPGMFNPGTSEVESAILPFYKTYSVFKVTNYASLPSFSFQYLSDGQYFHHLDGTALPLLAVNDKGELALNERTVIDYLSFYFEHVGMEDGGECYLIQNPQDMPQFEGLDDMTARAIVRNHEPPIASHDRGNKVFSVTAELYVDGQVNRATIEVKELSGRITIRDQKMVMNALGQPSSLETVY